MALTYSGIHLVAENFVHRPKSQQEYTSKMAETIHGASAYILPRKVENKYREQFENLCASPQIAHIRAILNRSRARFGTEDIAGEHEAAGDDGSADEARTSRNYYRLEDVEGNVPDAPAERKPEAKMDAERKLAIKEANARRKALLDERNAQRERETTVQEAVPEGTRKATKTARSARRAARERRPIGGAGAGVDVEAVVAAERRPIGGAGTGDDVEAVVASDLRRSLKKKSDADDDRSESGDERSVPVETGDIMKRIAETFDKPRISVIKGKGVGVQPAFLQEEQAIGYKSAELTVDDLQTMIDDFAEVRRYLPAKSKLYTDITRYIRSITKELAVRD